MRSAWQETPLAVRIVGILTLAWFVFLLLLLEGSQPCTGAEALDWWQLRARYLACRPANEVGDFLSGAFAPVAFAWLVATVFIQSSELKEQRRELALGREVAAEQREAMRAQAAEAASQTALLEAQADSQRRAAKDSEAISYLRSFADACYDGGLSVLTVTRLRDASRSGFRPLNKRTDNPDANIRAIAKNIRDVLRQEATETEPHPHAAKWVFRLRRVHDERFAMTPGNQKRIEELPLVQIANDLSRWRQDANLVE